jgi:rod shape-determining protein MreC
MGRDTRRSRVLLALLLAATFTLITIDYRTGPTASGPRGAVHAVFGPVEDGVSAVVRPVGRTVSALTHPDRYRHRAEALAAENAALRRQIASDAEVRRDASELASLRLLADKGQYTIVPARVIAVGDVSGSDRTVTINAGRAAGLRPDELVIDNDGLVGDVLSATSGTATVRLVSDPDSHIGARLERTRLLGAIAGNDASASLTYTLYDASHQVKVGDRLVTFGSSDFAAGVPIGVVTKVLDEGQGLSRTADVKPFASLDTLDLIGVIVGKPPTDPGDRVLPPLPVPKPAPTKPAPTPTPTPTASAGAGLAAVPPGTG